MGGRNNKYILECRCFLCHAKLLFFSIISLAAIGFYLVSTEDMTLIIINKASQSWINNDPIIVSTTDEQLPKPTSSRLPIILNSSIIDYQVDKKVEPAYYSEKKGEEEEEEEADNIDLNNNNNNNMETVDPLMEVMRSSTPDERIAWFRKKLPHIKIFKSDNMARQFHSRVGKFFNLECEGKFFMTWIKAASSFHRRQVLAVESLFKSHPRGCLIILSRDMDSKQGYRVLKPIMNLGYKVEAVTPDLSFLFNNTPAQGWFSELKSGNKDPGEIPLPQNLSNLMRLAVLYKYGGVYLDTDFIILKPLTGLMNSIGAQSVNPTSGKWSRLNNALLIFDMNHPLLLEFMREFAMTFNGNRWGHNGPYLVSRVVERLLLIGGGNRPHHYYYNLTVLPPLAFYPVDWMRIDGFFKHPKNEVESKWARLKLHQLNQQTYGIHLWNRHSSKLLIQQGSIIASLISQHCIICKLVSEN